MKMLKEKLDKLLLLKMVLFTRENGIRELIRKTAEEFKFGLMDQDMTVSGEMVSLKAMVDSSKWKVTFTKENGMLTKLMGSEFILITMETGMLVIGKEISSMVKE